MVARRCAPAWRPGQTAAVTAPAAGGPAAAARAAAVALEPQQRGGAGRSCAAAGGLRKGGGSEGKTRARSWEHRLLPAVACTPQAEHPTTRLQSWRGGPAPTLSSPALMARLGLKARPGRPEAGRRDNGGDAGWQIMAARRGGGVLRDLPGTMVECARRELCLRLAAIAASLSPLRQQDTGRWRATHGRRSDALRRCSLFPRTPLTQHARASMRCACAAATWCFYHRLSMRACPN